MFQRKTFVSISALFSVLAVGLAVSLAVIARPQTPSDASVKGSRTKAAVEVASDYLTNQVNALKTGQRVLEKHRQAFKDLDGQYTDLKGRFTAATETRTALIDLKLASDGWPVPAEAQTAQRAFSQFIDQGITFAEAYFRYVNLSAAVPITEIAVLRQLSQGYDETLTRAQTVQQEDTQLLSASGAGIVDTDQDGLTDAWERIGGTDVTLPDTDSDGLTDTEEFLTYYTQPLEPDTDQDGFSDGEETANGYSALGAGRAYGTDTL